jgi:hypothetical protein
MGTACGLLLIANPYLKLSPLQGSAKNSYSLRTTEEVPFGLPQTPSPAKCCERHKKISGTTLGWSLLVTTAVVTHEVTATLLFKPFSFCRSMCSFKVFLTEKHAPISTHSPLCPTKTKQTIPPSLGHQVTREGAYDSLRRWSQWIQKSIAGLW